jgi:hypothetical protein
MPEMLTDEEVVLLEQVGQGMCRDMLRSARAADRMGQLGFTSVVTDDTVTAWIAIADDFKAAFDELEANRTL